MSRETELQVRAIAAKKAYDDLVVQMADAASAAIVGAKAATIEIGDMISLATSYRAAKLEHEAACKLLLDCRVGRTKW